jgi:RimJ/RimL family protein N-acetyltransferase
MTTLRTERLLLRKAEAADLSAIHAILSDPRATRFWSTPPHATLAQSRDWLAGMIEIDPTEGEDFVVEHRGVVIGKAGFYRYPEVGFIFHPDHWGQGFAGEALSAVLDWGLSSRPEAIADVDPRNAASLKLLTRLGFLETGRKEKTWLVGDEWCDSVYLRLDAEAWRASAASR